MLGWLVDGPNNNFEIWRADGPVHCPRSAGAARLHPDSDAAMPGGSLHFSEFQLRLRERGKAGPVSAACEAPGQLFMSK